MGKKNHKNVRRLMNKQKFGSKLSKREKRQMQDIEMGSAKQKGNRSDWDEDFDNY